MRRASGPIPTESLTLAMACRETTSLESRDRWSGVFGHYALGCHLSNVSRQWEVPTEESGGGWHTPKLTARWGNRHKTAGTEGRGSP